MRRRRKEKQRVSRKPQNLAFKQQKLKAWQPLLNSRVVLPWLFLIGIIMIPIGAGLLALNNTLKELKIDYTRCPSQNGTICYDSVTPLNSAGADCVCTIPFNLDEDLEGEVFMYYRLTNYVQNHRRYVRSRDDRQLHNMNIRPIKATAPLRSVGGVNFAPAGFIANSMFNDTFELLKDGVPIPLTAENIAWPSDFNTKFRGGLQDKFNNTLKPPNWPRPAWDLAIGNTPGLIQGFRNVDFINWMRISTLSTFRKLYRRVVGGSLPRGQYVLRVKYNYPVYRFQGSKVVVFATMSALGGKNSFIPICYLVLGSLALFTGIVLSVIVRLFPRHISDDKYLTW